jgi:Zn-dependent protease with chaperone function
MLTIEQIYPPSPAQVPPQLTAPTATYRRQSLLVLACIVAFVALYLAAVVGAGYGVYWSIAYPMENVNKLTLLGKVGAVAISVMFFGFLVKFIFKSSEQVAPGHLEVTEKEQPVLFAFIRQICQETGAPFPHKVYLNHEMNACVFYHHNFWNLFFPTKKNLLIGLGLVNQLNLTEFKAVLAHEFGHFSQRTMALGSYIYVANRVIYDMVYTRDKWDELLAEWQQADFRLAIFGWILGAVVWVVRKLMVGIFQVINLVNASLSRQMEFNADAVAVSVTGSDAIVRALYKLVAGDAVISQTMQDLYQADRRNLHARDLFFHQSDTLAYLRQRDASLGNPPPSNAQQMIFSETDSGAVNMYASHPPMHQRERHAKQLYVPGLNDDRSAWLAFAGAEALRQTVTRQFYEVQVGKDKYAPSDDVLAFIAAERGAQHINEHERKLYDLRNLSVFRLELPGPAALAISPFDEDYDQKVAKYAELTNIISAFNESAAQSDGKKFVFQGRKLTPAEFGQEKQRLTDAIDQAEAGWREFDQRVFQYHCALAQPQGEAAVQDVIDRYTFHLGLVTFAERAGLVQQLFGQEVAALSELRVDEGKEAGVAAQLSLKFGDLQKKLGLHIAALPEVKLPDIPNEPTGMLLRDYLGQNAKPTGNPPAQLQLFDYWLRDFDSQLGTMLTNVYHINQKSLAGILSLGKLAESQPGA